MLAAELGSQLSYTALVEDPGANATDTTSSVLVEVVPEYWAGDQMAFMRVFFLAAQVCLLAFATLGGGSFYVVAVDLYGGMNRLAAGARPILDLRYAENVVLWCRIRDARRQSFRFGVSVVALFASVSVLWAAAAALASLTLVHLKAAWTPFRAICLWYALAGGATAFVQVFALYMADREVEKTQYMLADRLEQIQHEAVVEQRNPERSTTLRAAADAIEAELKVHRHTPHRRQFYLLGQSAGKVLATVGIAVGGQAVGYAWSWLQVDLDEDLGGSGSSGADCDGIFQEMEGC
jgi:hypothetical protein